jgi:hypothetical protein
VKQCYLISGFRLKESLTLHALYPVPFCVMCYAVDDLPKLAERYGQAAVDAALRTIAHTFESGLRPTDFLGRWLDQEFLASASASSCRRPACSGGATCSMPPFPSEPPSFTTTTTSARFWLARNRRFAKAPKLEAIVSWLWVLRACKQFGA